MSRISSNGRINVFLDLDQTIISGEDKDDKEFKNIMVKKHKFVWHDDGIRYVIFERPGLQKFLTFLFDNFNVSVWTAASQDYALFIVKNIILGNNSNRKLDFVLFGFHRDMSDMLHKPLRDSKKLSMMWSVFGLDGYSEDNTLILDDFDVICKMQPQNCVGMPEFFVADDGSENDKVLDEVKDKLRSLKHDWETTGTIRPSVEAINSFLGTRYPKLLKKK